jgi:molecular chaperone HtpG
MSSSETFTFQAEINQLLSLIINAFYSNKDIFLRELVSNATDAIDKIRYASLTDPSVLGDEKDLGIKIIPDKTNNTLTISDNGLGMTKADLIKNLGTIAHSGTKAFIESLSDASSSMSLIGQFGVGFYSAYLVANKVSVISKHNDEESAFVWESSASGTFTVTEYSEKITRGTKITLYMKDDLLEYLEESKITEIIKKHSQYCPFPINLYVERDEEKKKEEIVEKEITDTNKDTEGDVEEEEEDDDEIVKENEEIVKTNKFILLNKQSPIWVRKPEDVSDEEYSSFYKSFTGDWEDYLQLKHFSVDGQIQFKSLLYIPRKAPFDIFQQKEKKENIKLYVKKVLISSGSENSFDMLPEYLGFVKGIVDSDDLPLNVSREMLQQTSLMKVIKKNLTKKCIDMMTELTSDQAKFDTFYEAFGKNIKLGVHEDSVNRNKLVELLRFASSTHDKTSLKDYVTRMKEGQKKIYFISAENIKAAKSSPFIEKLVKMKIEVLFLVDPIDEYMVQTMKDYDDKPLACCSKDGLEDDLGQVTDEEKKNWEKVCDSIQNVLKSKVMDVKISSRLATNPCVLVSDQYGWTANMERIMKAQALGGNNGDMLGMMQSRKILEINPDHFIMKDIKAKIDENKNITNIVNILYETVLIDSGFSLEDPSKYAQNIYRLISNGLSGTDDGDDIVVESDVVMMPPPPSSEETGSEINSMEEVD